jgi:hypothetical protein
LEVVWLLLAVCTKTRLVVDCLLSEEVDMNATMPKGNGPGMLALLEKRCEILKKLVERTEVKMNTFFPGQQTVLAAAVRDRYLGLHR